MFGGPAAGPESLAETVIPVMSKLRKGQHLAAADGSRSLQAAAKMAGTPSLQGVSHIRHLFTPLSTIPKKGLRTDEVSLLRHLTKQGSCKESRTSFLLVGGDNVAESLAAVTKSQLRRHGLQKVVNDPIEHRNVLAVHYVSKKPGLESVLNALARFKELAMKSCRQPALVFKEAPWDA